MDINNLGVGVDIEDIKRFEKYSSDRKHLFLKKVYTPNEIEYCFNSKKPAKHLAVRFCAKEAIYKAFCSVGVFGLSFLDVEIVNDSKKVPKVVFLSEKTKGYSCKLSLSHTGTTAIASVIVMKNGKSK